MWTYMRWYAPDRSLMCLSQPCVLMSGSIQPCAQHFLNLMPDVRIDLAVCRASPGPGSFVRIFYLGLGTYTIYVVGL
jgi:hypothetical protein